MKTAKFILNEPWRSAYAMFEKMYPSLAKQAVKCLCSVDGKIFLLLDDCKNVVYDPSINRVQWVDQY